MAVVTYVIGLLKEYIRQGCPCLFRSATGLYCPGCGGTRAFMYLLRGDIGKSLWYHPLVGYMAVVAAAELGAWAWRRRREKERINGEADKRLGWNSRIRADRFLGYYEMEVYVGIGITAVNWLVKNWALLGAGVELIP